MGTVDAEVLLEACYPLGDARYARAVKKAAIRAVILERKSYREAARLSQVKDPKTVAAWCDQFEERFDLAIEFARSRGSSLLCT